jgi:hypothetical protein
VDKILIKSKFFQNQAFCLQARRVALRAAEFTQVNEQRTSNTTPPEGKRRQF